MGGGSVGGSAALTQLCRTISSGRTPRDMGVESLRQAVEPLLAAPFTGIMQKSVVEESCITLATPRYQLQCILTVVAQVSPPVIAGFSRTYATYLIWRSPGTSAQRRRNNGKGGRGPVTRQTGRLQSAPALPRSSSVSHCLSLFFLRARCSVIFVGDWLVLCCSPSLRALSRRQEDR